MPGEIRVEPLERGGAGVVTTPDERPGHAEAAARTPARAPDATACE